MKLNLINDQNLRLQTPHVNFPKPATVFFRYPTCDSYFKTHKGIQLFSSGGIQF